MKKNIGYALTVLGVVLVVISLGADLLGIGSYPGIHSAQLIPAAIGVIAAIVGVWLSFSKPTLKNQ